MAQGYPNLGVVQPSKEASPQKSTPPPAFTTVAQQKAFHRRSSSDIVSPSKGWGSPSVPAAAQPATADEELDLSDLADLLGGGLALVSRTGESSPPRVASGEDVTKAALEERNDSTSNTENIAPVVIRQRAPPAAFSVTSRPAQHERQRSTTMVPAGSAAAEKAAASFNATNRSFSATVVPSPSPTTAPTLKAPPSQARPAKSSPPTEGTRSSSYSDLGIGARQRSSTLIPNPALSSSRSDARTATSSSSNDDSAPSSSGSSSAASRARPRSSTMMTLAPASAAAPPSRLAAPLTQAPARPFMAARKSPASSTGESSSSPAPLTPRDGSSDLSRDSGMKEKDERRVAWSGGVSGLVPSARRAHQRRSVSFDFDEEVPSDGKGKIKARPRETPIQEEERRRERRRGEAKAAIELGNVINGPGPTADDDDEDDDDVPVAQRAMPGMPMGNMPMGMNMPMPMGFATPGGMSPGWPGMLSPAQFMVPPPADPNFYAAHQQAMMIAKQAYQMAVAQQAMQQAGEEWERGSTMGFGDRSSVFGGSTTGPAMSSYGMGMGMQQGGWTPGGMSLFPPAPRSMYGGGGARSEYGGGGGGGARSEYGGGGGWNSSRSVYGENFGPSPRSSNSPAATRNPNTRVDSGYFAGAPVPKSPNPTGATPRQRTASQPATPSRGPAKRQPPSSWKASP
ncbi:hypothetical protein FB45DRAFT_1126478 [Roridomyces roridus]|uniref:Uncharacterized protein n=1 Tax=Roridomyces roridus TaxID=1738132 RepID=A0AAD7C931_9AGAR|nr:hypothetical protein FB45DRAFT_1126478 [Roridomyces roridus]